MQHQQSYIAQMGMSESEWWIERVMVITAYLKVTSRQSFGTTEVWGTLGALPNIRNASKIK